MDKSQRRRKITKKPDKTVLGRTLFLMIVCGVVAFIVLGIHLYKIMIVRHDYYERKAVEQQTSETTLAASRGAIYDRNMKILAMSATAETVFISPNEIERYEQDKDLIADGLSRILNADREALLAKMEDTDSKYKTVAVKIEKETADEVREFRNTYELKGIYIVPDTKRYYPYSSLAANVIGFVGVDNYGLNGIEAAFDETLQGVNGSIVRAQGSDGTDMLYTSFENYLDAQDGESVVLTIDATVQYYLEKHLSKAAEDYDAENGAVGIVMDVNTAEILGMASYPNYDPNNYQAVGEKTNTALSGLTGDEYKNSLAEAQLLQWRNKALTDTYEPGSTFKIITLAAGLEEGVISEESTFYCGGSIDVLGRTSPLHCWKTQGHGSQTLAEAAQHSCNVAFVKMGLSIGAETFYDYIEAFGFFDSTGIDLPGEAEGIWWPEKLFESTTNLSQLAAASFGQTFNITPIQLITAVSAVANGGYLLEPYIVGQVLDPEGDVVKKTEPTVIRQVISEKTSETVCSILETVVGNSQGTGKNAYVAGYRIAGKTGTSINTTIQAATGEKEYIVSFVGFAPADDPQYAVLVMLDSPSSGTGVYLSGGAMAAPTVGSVFADILPYLGVEPEYTQEELENLDVEVPNLKALTAGEAQSLLTSNGFKMKTAGSGETVTAQLPAAGAAVAEGTTVLVYMGESKPSQTVKVPDLTRLKRASAMAALENAGLYMSTAGVIGSSSQSITVSKQSIEAGAEVKIGTVVKVTLVDSNTTIMETTG